MLGRTSRDIRALQGDVARLAKSVAAQRDGIAAVHRVVRRIDRTGGRGQQADLLAVRQAAAMLVRQAALDGVDVPYPERLRLGRFRLLSQNEEDGITLALLRATGFGPRRFVEIGCGTNGGNSGFLVDELGWEGMMVDADPANADAVRRRFNPELLTVVQTWITAENVEDVVRAAGYDGELGFLSIDIDGNDYWVWNALEAVRPAVVCVEYNSLWGPDRAVVVPYDPAFDRLAIEDARGHYYGASLAALAVLAQRKGYRLVTTDHRGVNAYFVRDDLAPEIPATSARRAYRLLDKARAQLEDGWDLEAFVAERRLPVIDVG